MNKIDQTAHINRIHQDYSDTYKTMNWLSPEDADRANHTRKALIKGIFNARQKPEWQFSGTKLITHGISPGCSLCGNGDWSCLFINGICNARCFYCPSSQKEKGLPVTSTVEFSNPHDYADYVKTFKIKGVSFSGGEPLMTFDRVLLFLKTLRSKVSHPLYIWMYTNGLLVTQDKLKALRDNGLDEIRFDISANQYDLGAMEKALGIIPNVTVEIPAIPEDLKATKQVIKTLYGMGVNYLNLHQIRCTPFNTPRLIERGYTFVHGPGVTVLETELTALKLIQFALDENIDLPINYCSFTYRHQFQRAGAQSRNARHIKADHEDITPTGHIRTMSLCGESNRIEGIHDQLLSQDIDRCLWKLSKSRDQLFFNEQVWPFINGFKARLKVTYSHTALKQAVSFRNPFKEVILNKKRKVVIERQTKEPGLWLEGEQIHQFANEFIPPAGHHPQNIPGQLPGELHRKISLFESFEPGLAPYF